MPPKPHKPAKPKKEGEVTELNKTAVAAVLGKFRVDGSGRPLSAATVTVYVASDPTFPKATRRGPKNSLIWTSDQIPALEAWAKARPGRGAGGGRPWPKPLLSDGYVACAECEHPVERHDTSGCHPLKGACRCTVTHWTPLKIQGARLAHGFEERFELEGSTV